jgi:hypothetical protein
MNFFQFLKSNNDKTAQITHEKSNSKINTPIIKQSENKLPRETSKPKKLSNTLLGEPLNMLEPIHYKKGDFIKIIYLENSPLNNYKGYNGEIRQYVKNSDYAFIVLEAINNSASIKFPVEHFIKIQHSN